MPRGKTGTAVICLLACASISLGSCVSTNTRVGGIEPTYYPLEGKKYEVVGEAEGESSSFNLFWLIPVTPGFRMEEAVGSAISEKGGDNMINLRWWMRKQHWILGTVNVIQVQGTVIRYIGE